MRKQLAFLSVSMVGSLSVLAGAVAVQGNAIPKTNLAIADAQETVYELNLKNLSESNQTLTTSNGNSVEFAVDGFDGTTFQKEKTIKNTTAISGVKSITFSFADDEDAVYIYYGWGLDDYDVSSEAIKNSNPTYTFSNRGPSFFRINCSSSRDVTITSMTLEYTCEPTDIPLNLVYFFYSADAGKAYSVHGRKQSIVDANLPSTYNDKSVTKIDNNAFSNASGSSYLSLKTVNIPDSVTAIGTYAFYYCGAIESVSFGSGLTSIGEFAFAGCSRMGSVTLPNSISALGRNAFNGCAFMRSVNIPTSLSGIQPYVFASSGIESITIPSSINTISDYAFSACSRLETVTIQEGLARIYQYAFYNCDKLETIHIPASVVSINSSAFVGCENLYYFYVGATNNNYTSNVGVLYSKSMDTLVIYPPARDATSYEVLNTVTEISPYAFSGATNLTSITLPAPTGYQWKVYETGDVLDTSDPVSVATALKTTHRTHTIQLKAKAA